MSNWNDPAYYGRFRGKTTPAMAKATDGTPYILRNNGGPGYQLIDTRKKQGEDLVATVCYIKGAAKIVNTLEQLEYENKVLRSKIMQMENGASNIEKVLRSS